MHAQGLYDPVNEHDACGVGLIAQIKGVKSHKLILDGLSILKNLDHRGAVGADKLMGDGAGILIQIPDELYRQEMAAQDVVLPPRGEYGVGMIFLPKEHASRLACEQEIERAVRAEGQIVLGWRDVRIDLTMPMSPAVRQKEPVIRQIFIGRGPDIMVTDALERKLYVIRKSSGHAIAALQLMHGKEFFVPSMSARTVVYKGLLLADQVGRYYQDLQDTRCVSAFALVHQRFSTNTFPAWPLAHPYRLIAHNGEINTIKGNFNWMRAREHAMRSAVLGDDLQKLYPLIYEGQSDTACFDNTLELLVMAGYPIAQAMMMMIPQAWENHPQLDDNWRAFYEYHAAMMEPWDGPAAMVFTDGQYIGGMLDRNGLRPASYLVTKDDYVVMASEAGVLPIAESNVIKKWRLQPGKMFLIDLAAGRIIDDQEIKNTYASAKPYRAWVDAVRIKLDELKSSRSNKPSVELTNYAAYQAAFAYTPENVDASLLLMAITGEESVGSMGSNTPLAVLSRQPTSFYNYFKQLFAQVTNPPIDPIREAMVMSLMSNIGPKPNLLDTNNINPPMRLEVTQPVLSFTDMAKLRDIDTYTNGKFKSYEISICYPVAWGKEGIEAHLASLCAEAVDAVRSGHNILIVSDRKMDAHHVAIPALLATSAMHLHLVKKGLRASTGLVVETGSAYETHHIALLAGYGAQAVHPYLALETIINFAARAPKQYRAQELLAKYTTAIGKGLMRVMAKMGISTYMSYCGAQIFEAIGLHKSLVDHYFKGTACRIGGIDVFDVAQEALHLHQLAFSNSVLLENSLQDDEDTEHIVEPMWTPAQIERLQRATRENDFTSYQEFARIMNAQSAQQLTLRSLFVFKTDAAQAISLEEVEPAKEIVKRFVISAMSVGAISTEAHATLALAMNRLGAKSTSGEGGEDPLRYTRAVGANTTMADLLGSEQVKANIALLAGDSLRSEIKQVASGRFGVTAAYLNAASDIEVKISQGASPGEGGYLPSHKVSPYVAQLRFSAPYIGLASPASHHDLYSIEDSAQLIYELRNVNPHATISIKLASVVGVGTIAAGVVKAKANRLVIAGHDGGTAASFASSIAHTGAPFELGLSEVQQTLLLNNLRSNIKICVDGQIKTGRDVVVAALLGADEVGFATAPLIVEGCKMLRQCHLNTCPTGIATQDPVLRAQFSGMPEHVINYFFFVAQEVREIMATLGIKTYDALVGRVDLLDKTNKIVHEKMANLDFSTIFYRPVLAGNITTKQSSAPEYGLEKTIDYQWLDSVMHALEKQEKISLSSAVSNVNRAVGTMLSGEIVRRYPGQLFDNDTVHLVLTGTAGQSAGAFLVAGITLELVGGANDYVGKGLSGGRIIVRPRPEFCGLAVDNMIVGNTVLYGATSGEVFFNGVAGERFAVRNSGATAVVEGIGNHGCEYMTGGVVLILGDVGRNFAAGMSGGVAYVYDPSNQFANHCHIKAVTSEKILPACMPTLADDEVLIYDLMTKHVKYTKSARAQLLLAQWEEQRHFFVKISARDVQGAVPEKLPTHVHTVLEKTITN